MTTIEVTFKGPFLTGDPSSTLHQAVQAGVQELVELGEQRLDKMLRPRPAGVYLSVAEARRGRASKGHYRRNVRGYTRDLAGFITDGGKVVYGPWLEGVSPRNQATRFKGYASFRRTGQWLQAQAQRVMDHHIRGWAERMG